MRDEDEKKEMRRKRDKERKCKSVTVVIFCGQGLFLNKLNQILVIIFGQMKSDPDPHRARRIFNFATERTYLRDVKGRDSGQGQTCGRRCDSWDSQ